MGFHPNSFRIFKEVLSICNFYSLSLLWKASHNKDTLTIASEKAWTVFIDTNPSFSIYTQIALSGAERIVVAINADDFPKTAASAMMAFLHGSNPPHPIYGSRTYAERAKLQNVTVPKAHLLIGNRLTQFKGPAAAFGAFQMQQLHHFLRWIKPTQNIWLIGNHP